MNTDKAQPSAATRESLMVVIERNEAGTPTVWCDPEIVDLVTALNKGGIRTIASCSGHGQQPGNIALTDGRELIIAASFDEARQIEAKISAATPTPTPATGSGGEACEVCRIFGDSNLLRKSATPINSADDEMVLRALEAPSPEAVTNRYGYRKGYRVRDILALDDYEATEVMRAAITAALAHPAPAGGDAGDAS